MSGMVASEKASVGTVALMKGVGGNVLQTSFDQTRESVLREAIAAAVGSASAS
jgi:uncharacterized membrane protein